MRTVRNSSRLLGGGGVVPGPGGSASRGVPGPGGAWSWGGVPGPEGGAW